MAEQASQLEFVHTSQFTTPVAEDYARELLEFAGENFSGGAVYFTCGGSESVETALKLARQYQVEIGQTKRYQVLSRTQSYHGSTLGALSVSGNKRRREMYLPMVREFAHVGIPYCYRCDYDCTDGCRNCGLEYAAELERAIEAADGEAAAFIFEPVSGATLGAVVPPPGYLQTIAEVCRRHGVLLIADEVMTGMGRTGRNFAVEHWDIAPDILIAAKGLSSGYARWARSSRRKKLWMASPREHSCTASPTTPIPFRWRQDAPCCIICSSRIWYRPPTPVARAALPPSWSVRFRLARLEDGGDVRGIGLLRGVEFVSDKPTKKPFPPELNFAGRITAQP